MELHSPEPSNGGELVVDPVCGMRIDPRRAKHSAEREGTSFHFCSRSCHDKFVANPDRLSNGGFIAGCSPFAFGYNAVGVPVAAGILYPFFGLLLNPMIAAAAMSFSSVSVIANALRLKRVQI